MLKQAREDIGDEVDHEMADHVGHEIASPKIEESKHGAEHQRDDDVGPAARPMRNGEDEERNTSRPKAIQTKCFKRSMA